MTISILSSHFQSITARNSYAKKVKRGKTFVPSLFGNRERIFKMKIAIENSHAVVEQV